MKTKNELFEHIGSDGIGFFAVESQGAKELYQKFNGTKYSVSLDDQNSSVTATDVVYDSRGTTFTLRIKGEEPIVCSTVLLGKHSVKNICLASAVASQLGLTAQEIALGINRITSIGHRLELLPNNKNIVTIDDSYNCNEDGIVAAIEVLDTFNGRKIVVTPGLVELGKRENIANFEFGKLLAQHADIVIIVGKHNAEMLINGLLEGGMDKQNIMFEKNSSRGNQTLNTILKEGDVVLFENDLPDNYN
jgi:UDP-N-acetylmuramoyl-tripeptide--D-alanyl-D-alanine ligase